MAFRFRLARKSGSPVSPSKVLLLGEPGIEINGGQTRMKIGDGFTPWSGLPWIGDTGTSATSRSSFLVFDKKTAALNSEIFVRAPGAATETQLTNDATYQSWWPKWSPDGSRILFLRVPAANTNYDSDLTKCSLWVMNSDGTSPVQIRAQVNGYYIGTPNWHPNGRDIYFFGGAGVTVIQKIRADGSSQSAITVTAVATGVADTNLTPDGSSIVFTYLKNIYIVPVAGGAASALTTDGATNQNYDPAPSPDGSTVAMLTQTGGVDGGHPLGQWAIRTVSINAGAITTIIDDGNVNSKCTWGGDGRIYFHRFEYGVDSTFSLASLRSDGTGSPLRLTASGTYTYPDYLINRTLKTPGIHARSHLNGGADPIAWSFIHNAGLLASRPAASSVFNAYYYFATDVNGGTLYWCNGSTWLVVSNASSVTMAVSATQTTVSNTAVETSLMDEAITGALAGDLYSVRAWGDYQNNSGSGKNYNFKFYVGSDTPLATPVIATSTSASLGRWYMDLTVVWATSAAQIVGATLAFSEALTGTWIPAANTYVGYGVGTQTAVSNPHYKLTATMSAADASANIRIGGYSIERKR